MKTHSFHRCLCRAFTITELLIATAIVVVLCALAMGAREKVLQGSHAAQCQRQLRNLAQAGLLYAADNGGKLPDRTRWQYITAASEPLSLLPYMGVKLDGNVDQSRLRKLLLCPVANHSEYRPENDYKSFSINQYATGGDVGNPGTWQEQVQARESPTHLLQVQNPSKQAFFMDGPYNKDSFGGRFSAYQDSIRLTPRDETTGGSWKTPYLHSNGFFVVFLDGHVEHISREYAEAELVGPANPSDSQAHTSPRRHSFWGAGK